MTDSQKILDGIYAFADTPVIVYEPDGKIIWKNKYADIASENNPELFSGIFAHISKEKNAQIENYKIRRLLIYDNEYYVAEFYEDHSLQELFNKPQVSEFALYNESLTRKSVSSILQYSEFIRESFAGNEDNRFQEYFKIIVTSCCRLMKSASLSRLLAENVSQDDSGCEFIQVDNFLSTLAKLSSASLSESCEVIYKTGCNKYIKSNVKVLTYLILGIISRMISRESCDKHHIEISAEYSEKNVKIKFSSASYNSEASLNPGGANEVEANILKIYSGKIGAYSDLSAEESYIMLESAENNGEISLESAKTFFDDSMFSPYNIMFSDLEDFNFFE